MRKEFNEILLYIIILNEISIYPFYKYIITSLSKVKHSFLFNNIK